MKFFDKLFNREKQPEVIAEQKEDLDKGLEKNERRLSG